MAQHGFNTLEQIQLTQADPRCRPHQPIARAAAELPQAQASGSEPQLVLHGRQVPWLLRHYNRVLARPIGRPLRQLRSST